MKLRTRITGLSFGMSALLSTTALADITSQQTWDDWKSYMEDSGYTVSAQETATASSLTVTNILMTMDMPEDDMKIAVSMPQIDFRDQGDGSVRMDWPTTMPINMNIVGDGESFGMTFDYSSSPAYGTATGTPGDIVYEFNAERMAMSLTDLNVPDADDIPQIDAAISIDGMKSTYNIKTGNMRTVSQMMSADTVGLMVKVIDPTNTENMLNVSASLSDVEFDGNNTLPRGMDPNNVAAMLREGFGGVMKVAYKDYTAELLLKERGDRVNAKASVAQADGTIYFAEDGLKYESEAEDVAIDVTGGEFPFPLAFKMENMEFGLTMPIAKSDSAQDIGLKIKLGDFTMSDMIWGVFDPMSQLPRDPATIALDATGSAKLLVDFLNPEEVTDEAIRNMEGMPVLLESAKLNQLLVSAVGASIEGSGEFTFDNNDLESFDGMPRPEGTLKLRADGANGLLDRLVKMGLLSEQDAMGARMMSGMFTVPGPGDDSLTSTIEIKKDGSILANGQRLK